MTPNCCAGKTTYFISQFLNALLTNKYAKFVSVLDQREAN